MPKSFESKLSFAKQKKAFSEQKRAVYFFDRGDKDEKLGSVSQAFKV